MKYHGRHDVPRSQPTRNPHRRDVLNRATDITNNVLLAAVLGPFAVRQVLESTEDTPGFSARGRGEHLRTYETGRLSGRRFGGMIAAYLGLPSGARIPRSLSVDFTDVQDALWEEKLARIPEAQSERRAEISRLRDRITGDYREDFARGEHDPVSLQAFSSRLAPVVEGLKNSINWSDLNALDEFRDLSDADVRLVEAMSRHISKEMLLAYAATELMPLVNESDVNIDVMEFLLRNAGAKFLSRIPAVHDTEVSFGLFQFTPFALDAGPPPTGASIINQLVADASHRIPDSVPETTDPDDQFRAAYLFAVENIARLIKSIRANDSHRAPARIAVLERSLQRMGRPRSQENFGLMQFISSAHHYPDSARDGFRNWIDHGLRGSHVSRSRGRIREYILKSHGNYQELLERLVRQ